MPDDAPRLVEVDWGGRSVAIEHAWIGSTRHDAPLFVFLHEGLGSLAMWKDFPRALCDALGARGLVYSRPGYGASTPRPPDERWDVDFMHRQAHEVLPAFLAAVGVGPAAPAPWLFGHSDGGSIALLYAARFPGRVAGLVVLAPHVFVEDVGLASIDAARQTFLTGNSVTSNISTDTPFWATTETPARSRLDRCQNANPRIMTNAAATARTVRRSGIYLSSGNGMTLGWV